MSTLLYKLTILLIRILGIKRNFSEDPINYEKIRKDDEKEPKNLSSKKFIINEIRIKQSLITEIVPKERTKRSSHILFIPGGAFISGPTKHHWDFIKRIVSKTQLSLWLIDYPKAPEKNINQINENINAVYELALEKKSEQKLILIGDSVGANLIMSLTQRLIEEKTPLPYQLILMTPVFDSSMSNKAITMLDNKDPMLSKLGVLSAKKLCARGIELKDPRISPLYGSFKNFPRTMLFLGGRDIMFADGLLGMHKMKEAGVELEVIIENRMPHIYPLLPLMTESKNAMQKIVDEIRNELVIL